MPTHMPRGNGIYEDDSDDDQETRQDTPDVTTEEDAPEPPD